MKVNLGTIEINETSRRAINHHYGEKGLATRERCRNFIIGHGQTDLQVVVTEWMEMEPEEFQRIYDKQNG